MITQIEGSDQAATVTTWTMQVRGIRKLPQRLLFNIADFSRLLWWSTVAVVPAVLLTTAVFVGDFFIYVYSMYSAVMMMGVSQASERFINTTVKFDQDVGELVATYRLGKPNLGRNEREVTVSFEDVEVA